MESEVMLQELMRYNNWANGEIFKVCRPLGVAELDKEILGGFGTVYETLVHMVQAEAAYVRHLTDVRPEPPFAWDERPGLDELQAFAADVGAQLAELAQTVPLTKQIVRETDDVGTLHFNALLVFIQVVNHGIEHRTNITTALNLEGYEPPDVAGWGYLLAHRERFGG